MTKRLIERQHSDLLILTDTFLRKRDDRQSQEGTASFCAEIQYTLVGAWLSLVEHRVRDAGVGGSTPLAPTILFWTANSELYLRRLDSHMLVTREKSFCLGLICVAMVFIPLPAAAQRGA